MSTTTSSGADSPAGICSAASSKPTRVSCPSGNWRSAPLPKSSESAGMASASRTPAARIALSAERFITAAVQRAQKSPEGLRFTERTR